MLQFAIGPQQFLRLLSQAHFVFLALGDVVTGSGHANRLAILVPDRLPARVHPDETPIGAAAAILRPIFAFMGQVALQRAEHPFAVVIMDPRGERFD